MDKDKTKEIREGIGALSEMALLFRRAAIGAGASEQEAFDLTKAYLWALLHGARPEDKQGGD